MSSIGEDDGAWLGAVRRDLPSVVVSRDARRTAVAQTVWFDDRAPVRNGGRIVELGCGNGEKLAALLNEAHAADVHAHLIDLSESALAHAMQTLDTVNGSSVRVTTHHTTYEDGLLGVPTETTGPTLVAMLGSNIGNFDRPDAAAFLGLIRAALRPGDYLLLGADLVKPEQELLLAYDDPLGLTAAFNKNLLLRLIVELEADIAIDRFAHRPYCYGDQLSWQSSDCGEICGDPLHYA